MLVTLEAGRHKTMEPVSISLSCVLPYTERWMSKFLEDCLYLAEILMPFISYNLQSGILAK